METRWGKRFGRYEVVSELGRGAMGVVYKARDPKIDRFVAVKTVSLVGHVPEEKEEYRERFFREAQAAGRLLHPGIVTIFDVGEDADGDGPYIVMEYVPGVSLNAMLSEGAPIPLESALRLTQQIAEALDCAHAQGIVHRDIKPANIMYEPVGDVPKVTDFGIARVTDSSKTKTGMVLGTPSYMSPEQLAGRKIDGRSDLFSLGVTMYQMLSGKLPFTGESMTQLMFAIANAPHTNIKEINTGLPDWIVVIVDKALAKDFEKRYQTGAEFAQAIREGRKANNL